MQAPERKGPPAVVFDSSIEDGIGQVLALAQLLSYQSRQEVRMTSLSMSRNNLKIAAFCDLMGRFFGASLSVGMSVNGKPETRVPPMLSTVLAKQTSEGKPAYPRVVEKLNDTADPVALIRNALTSQQDQNSVVVLAGPPINLLGLLALPEGRQLIQKKVRTLVIAPPFDDAAGFAKLIAQWPTSVTFVGDDLGQSFPFPAAGIEQDFAWSENHPLVDAYRSANPMPYDALATPMAAVLYAAHPEESYFKLSAPGVIGEIGAMSVPGRAQFTANPEGKHRQLLPDLSQKDRIVQAYRQTVSAKPPERRGVRGAQP